MRTVILRLSLTLSGDDGMRANGMWCQYCFSSELKLLENVFVPQNVFFFLTIARLSLIWSSLFQLLCQCLKVRNTFVLKKHYCSKASLLQSPNPRGLRSILLDLAEYVDMDLHWTACDLLPSFMTIF